MCKPLCSTLLLLALSATLQAQTGIPQLFPFSGTILHDGVPYDTEKPGNSPVDLQVYFFNGAPDAGSVAGAVFQQIFLNQPTNAIGAFALNINDPAAPVVGAWTAIDWLGGDVWMAVEADIANEGPEEVARFKVLPMPYAMYAGRTEQVNPANAVTGQVLKYNGTEFVPGTDSVKVYQPGAGISISGTTIAAQDPSATNELQTLSLSWGTTPNTTGMLLSLNPPAAGTSQPVNVAPRIAIVKEMKLASLNNAGAFSAGGWRMRMLTSVEPQFIAGSSENDFVSVSSGGYFTLQPGKYYIQASAPAYDVDQHMIALKKNNNDSTVIVGANAHTLWNTASAQTCAELSGFVDISVPTGFKIVHACTQTGNFGLLAGWAANLGIGNVPVTTVEIIKLR